MVSSMPALPVVHAISEQRWRDWLSPLLAGCRGITPLKQIHALTLRSASSIPRSISSGDFLFLYSRILHVAAYDANDLLYASRVLAHLLLLADSGFVHLPRSSSFFWNTLIRAHARSPHLRHLAIEFYKQMLLDGRIQPDKHTFPFVLRACTYLFMLEEGEQIHGHAVKLGLSSDIFVANSLIHFYSTCQRLDLASKMFDEMPRRSLVSWNVITDGFVTGGQYGAAVGLFREMQGDFEPDNFSLQSLVAACEATGALSLGMWAHAFALKRSIGDVLLYNSLVKMYAKCGSLSLARQVFDSMPQRNLASWNSMILGLSIHGLSRESLETFARMQEEGIKPDDITFIGVLTACSHGGLVAEGQVHFATMCAVHGLKPRIEHYGCMVDMFARAGRVGDALDLILGMPFKPDGVMWRSILDACRKNHTSIEVGEMMSRRAMDWEDEESSDSGGFVLLSRVYASAKRWREAEAVRKLMGERGIWKAPGCSSIEIDGTLHEFFAGLECCGGELVCLQQGLPVMAPISGTASIPSTES